MWVRAFAGLKRIPLDLKCMAFADIKTPTDLCGKKQAPILEKNDFGILIESTAIIHYLDTLKPPQLLGDVNLNRDITEALQKMSQTHLALCSPRFEQIKGIEFEKQADRDRYRKREESLICMSFEDALDRSSYLKDVMAEHLDHILLPVMQAKTVQDTKNILSLLQVFVFLRKLTIVKDFRFPHMFERFFQSFSERVALTAYPDSVKQ